MLKSLQSKILLAVMISSTLMSSVVYADNTVGVTPLPDPVSVKNYVGADPGVQLNRSREYMERERVARQIAEDQARRNQKVEDKNQAAEQKEVAVKFELKDLKVDKSEVLTEAEIEKIAKKYIGNEVNIKDLYRIVEKINKLYSKKGYLTCRAYLPPQTIKDGVVQIKLIEGKTGNVTVQGNKTTQTDYIEDRVHLTKGKIDNVNDLNKDLLLYNATHDAQLRISMQAGEAPGTTDYVITSYEPQQHVVTVFADNAGSESTGEYRTGMMYTDRSLTGHRDNLTMSGMMAEGSKSFSASYNRQIHNSGTELNVMYSTNSVEIIDGDLEDLDVKGHAYAASVGFTQPLVVTENTRTEASVTYNRQNSETDYMRQKWINDTINDATVAYAVTNYSDSSVLYSKHGYTFGQYEDIFGDTKNYGLYQVNAFYQKAYDNGHMLSARFDGQLSGNNYMPSARQFYIGGMYSVRGYKESVLGGDHGYAFSTEYAIPVIDNKTSAFTFFDYGAVHGDSAFDDHVLSSIGIGIKSTLMNKLYTSLTLGVPLQRDLNGSEASKARLHFMVNGQF